MNCKDVVLELSDYLDNELDAGTLAEIERHLSRCEHCRLVVDTTKKTIELYCESEPAPLPEDIRARLQKALESRLRRKGS